MTHTRRLGLILTIIMLVVGSAGYLTSAQRRSVRSSSGVARAGEKAAAPGSTRREAKESAPKSEAEEQRERAEKIRKASNAMRKLFLRSKQTNEPQTGVHGEATSMAVVSFDDIVKFQKSLPQSGEVTYEGGEENDVFDLDTADLPMPAGFPKPTLQEPAPRPKNARGEIEPLVPSPAPVQSFRALEDNAVANGTGGFSRSIPPDTHGAVGPSHVMTTLNSEIRIQDRNGNTLRTVGLDAFWASLGSPNAFDPRVMYDPYSGRWIIVATANSNAATSAVLIGASATSDPTGSWFLFSVDVDSTNAVWADFPSVGFNKNWAVVHVNMFNISDGNFNRSHTYVFNKAALYAGSSAPFTLFSRTDVGATLVPAVTYDPNLDTMYLLNQANSAQGALGLFRITGAVGSENLNLIGFPRTFVAWGRASALDNSAPQAGSDQLIATNDSRLQNVVYRNGSLWTTHTVFYPVINPKRSSIQWWQINPNATPAPGNQVITPLQVGYIDDPSATTFYAFPSLSVNANNDVLIGYSRFSRTQYASAAYSFRAGGDPANSLRDDSIIKPGESPYFKTFGGSDNRWGDYSATVVDPTNDLDMWTLQEYAAPTDTTTTNNPDRWGTWWARVRADGRQPGPSATPTPVPTPAPIPPNDNFANAQVLTDCAGRAFGNNESASKQAGEPLHATPNQGGKSIWYRWTAPANGTATFNTNGSTFDTVMGVYTGASVDNLTVIGNDDDGGDSLNSQVSFTASSGVTYFIAVDGFLQSGNTIADSGNVTLNWSLTNCVPGTQIQFDSPQFSVGEAAGVARLTVRRIGSAASVASANYATSDGTAQQRTDYSISFGTVTFAAGQTTQTIIIPITEDSYTEAAETFTVSLSSPLGASLGTMSSVPVTIVDNDAPGQPTNPIDTPAIFAQQHYFDFLSRQPDAGGYQFWTDATAQCGLNRNCLLGQRTSVSQTFFAALEYQRTGAYIYRVYRVAYGDNQPTPVEATTDGLKLPSYNVVAPDRARIDARAEFIAQSQQSVANLFVQRAEFNARYAPSLTAAQFVDAVLANVLQSSGIDLNSQRAALINLYNAPPNGISGRAAVIYRLADDDATGNPINNRAYITAEFNRAFVLTQYFGYLRRNPDVGGYNFWLGVINGQGSNGAQFMVCSFVTSQEYLERFGAALPYSNADCQ